MGKDLLWKGFTFISFIPDLGGVVAVPPGGYSPLHQAVASSLQIGNQIDWWAPSIVSHCFPLVLVGVSSGLL